MPANGRRISPQHSAVGNRRRVQEKAVSGGGGEPVATAGDREGAAGGACALQPCSDASRQAPV
jgi:hypothetical protein